ncbi:hypothetical protein [Micromonospora rubida]
MSLSLPEPPATGLVDDRGGIRWRHTGDGLWDPAATCPTCGTCLPGGLTWSQLLERGPLTPVTGGSS